MNVRKGLSVCGGGGAGVMGLGGDRVEYGGGSNQNEPCTWVKL